MERTILTTQFDVTDLSGEERGNLAASLASAAMAAGVEVPDFEWDDVPVEPEESAPVGSGTAEVYGWPE